MSDVQITFCLLERLETELFILAATIPNPFIIDDKEESDYVHRNQLPKLLLNIVKQMSHQFENKEMVVIPSLLSMAGQLKIAQEEKAKLSKIKSDISEELRVVNLQMKRKSKREEKIEELVRNQVEEQLYTREKNIFAYYDKFLNTKLESFCGKENPTDNSKLDQLTLWENRTHEELDTFLQKEVNDLLQQQQQHVYQQEVNRQKQEEDDTKVILDTKRVINQTQAAQKLYQDRVIEIERLIYVKQRKQQRLEALRTLQTFWRYFSVAKNIAYVNFIKNASLKPLPKNKK